MSLASKRAPRRPAGTICPTCDPEITRLRRGRDRLIDELEFIEEFCNGVPKSNDLSAAEQRTWQFVSDRARRAKQRGR